MKPFFFDTDFFQNFKEAGLEEKLVSAVMILGWEPTITTTCSQEHLDSVTQSIREDINTGAIKVFDDSPYGTFTGSNRGESSITAVIEGNEISNASIGIVDQFATKTFNHKTIRTFDHVEFLWIMVRIGVVSLIKASYTYVKWQPLPRRYREENFLLFYINQERHVLSKLGITALLV